MSCFCCNYYQDTWFALQELKVWICYSRYIKHIMWDTCCVVENQSRAYRWSLERINKRFVVSCIIICACTECTFCKKGLVLLMERKETVVWSLAVFPFALITYRNLVPYMQKTCDVAEKAILAKKKLRKKCVNRDKM